MEIGQAGPVNTIENTKLEKAVSVAASLVEDLGDEYWPVFERLDSELSKRQSRFKRLRKFRKLRESDQSSFD
jgi:hypothetical protein